jgi:hypothetical protein
LRHETDAPTIGIILCKGKNAVIVEYALRDSTKPMGIAEYTLSDALPAPLQASLPTAQEFAREFPLMSLVKLRIDIERELRTLLEEKSGGVTRPLALGELIRAHGELHTLPSIQAFLRIVNSLHHAAHGVDIPEDQAEEAAEIATRFLAEVREFRTSDL